MKRFCRSVFCIIFSVFLLTACGGGNSSNNDSAQNEQEIVDTQMGVSVFIDHANYPTRVFSGDSINYPIFTEVYSDIPDTTKPNVSLTLLNNVEGMSIEGSNLVYSVPHVNENTNVNVVIRASVEGTDVYEDYTTNLEIVKMSVISEEIVGAAGGVITVDDWGDFVIDVPAGAVQSDTTITVSEGFDNAGNRVFKIESSSETGEITVHLPDPNLINVSESELVLLQTLASVSESLQMSSWKSANAYFFINNRVAGSTITTFLGSVVISQEIAYELLCNKSLEEAEGLTPIVFIHGYTFRGGLGGGTGTWGKSFELFSDETRVLCDFQWRTSARFQDVAADLGNALAYVKSKTGKDAHLVAHSFGGLLSRTYLQGLATNLSYQNNVASLVTVGTPHSGIADKEKTLHEVTIPKGQDGFISDSISFEGCMQISCHQAGEYVAHVDFNVFDVYGISESEGEIVASLADFQVNPLPEMPVLVLIGLTTDYLRNTVIDSGDRLITYEGQRFAPELTIPNISPLLNGEFGNATLKEYLLGFGQDVRPNGNNPLDSSSFHHLGYKHSPVINNLISSAKPQVEIDCPSKNSCQHDTYIQIRDWLNDKSTEDVEDVSNMMITLSVGVDDPLTLQPVEGAPVRIKNMATNYISSVVYTDAFGLASVEVPFHPNTEYAAFITASGYKFGTYGKYTTSSNNPSSASLGRISLIKNTPDKSSVNVRVTNALTSGAIEGVQYRIYNTANNFERKSGITSLDGTSLIEDLPYGHYEIRMVKQGFITSVRYFNLDEYTGDSISFSMSPVVSDNQYRIVLEWGQHPNDLDSHLIKYNLSGEQLYHIYFGNKSNSLTGDNLDLDDTTSFGPETVTIQELDNNAKYIYVVHHFAGSGSITGTSAAEVTVSYGNHVRVFNTPVSGIGRYWKVFEIENGILTECTADCIYTDDTAYAASFYGSAYGSSVPKWLESFKNMPSK